MYFSRACHRIYEIIFRNILFDSTHHYSLLMAYAMRGMQRATTSSLHHPLQNFSHSIVHPLQISSHFMLTQLYYCSQSSRFTYLLSKSVTICNSANSLSQIGNRLNKLHMDSLLISTRHQSLLLGCAGLTRKGYIY